MREPKKEILVRPGLQQIMLVEQLLMEYICLAFHQSILIFYLSFLSYINPYYFLKVQSEYYVQSFTLFFSSFS